MVSRDSQSSVSLTSRYGNSSKYFSARSSSSASSSALGQELVAKPSTIQPITKKTSPLSSDMLYPRVSFFSSLRCPFFGFSDAKLNACQRIPHIEVPHARPKDIDPEVTIRLCVYQGRSLRSSGQTFLEINAKNQSPIAVGFAPVRGKAGPITGMFRSVMGGLKNCEAYLDKNNVKYMDLSFSSTQVDQLLKQLAVDAQHSPNEFDIAQLNDLIKQRLGEEIEAESEQPTVQQPAQFSSRVLLKDPESRSMNGIEYIRKLLAPTGVDIPRLIHSSKALWDAMDRQGQTRETPGGLPMPQSMTRSEYLKAHLQGFSSRVPAEMARHSIAVLQEIEEDLQKTFLSADTANSTVNIDIDMINRAERFLARFAKHLDDLNQITAYGFQKVLGKPVDTEQFLSFRQQKDITIDADGASLEQPNASEALARLSEVKVRLCSYPGRAKRNEGQAYLAFETEGRMKLAVGFAPKSQKAKRWSGLFGKMQGQVQLMTDHIGKSASKGRELNLSADQISRLLGQVNADASASGSTLSIANLGGIEPTVCEADQFDTSYRAAGLLMRHNNSVDYVKRLLNSVCEQNPIPDSISTPRQLAQEAYYYPLHSLHNHFIMPQSLTAGERVKSLAGGLNQGLPNLFATISDCVEEFRNHILALQEQVNLPESEQENRPLSLGDKLYSHIKEGIDIAVSGFNATSGLQRYAESNIQTIQKVIASLSRDFQIIAGRLPELPEGMTTFAPAAPLQYGLEAEHVIIRHRTVIPKVLRTTLKSRLALTKDIRRHLVKPMSDIKAQFGQDDITLQNMLSTVAVKPGVLLSAIELRKNMAEACQKTLQHMASMSAETHDAFEEMKV